MTSGTGLPSLNPTSLSIFAAGAKEFDEGIWGGAMVVVEMSGSVETKGVSTSGLTDKVVVVGVVVAGVVTEKATRPETTCPSGLINFQRAVMAPVSDGGSETTTTLSDDPRVGLLSCVRIPSPLMTSPENDSSGTDLANVIFHVLGAPSKTSPSDGELLSKELWAKAGLTPNAKSPTNRLNKKTINFDFESTLNFMNLLLSAISTPY
jgi:hypothetical protein